MGFLDQVELLLNYAQYLTLLLGVTPTPFVSWYTEPLVVLQALNIDPSTILSEARDPLQSAEIRLIIPPSLPIDLRLGFVLIAILAPLVMSTFGLLFLAGKSFVLWYLSLLIATFLITAGSIYNDDLLPEPLINDPASVTGNFAQWLTGSGIVLAIIAMIALLVWLVRDGVRKRENKETGESEYFLMLQEPIGRSLTLKQIMKSETLEVDIMAQAIRFLLSAGCIALGLACLDVFSIPFLPFFSVKALGVTGYAFAGVFFFFALFGLVWFVASLFSSTRRSLWKLTTLASNLLLTLTILIVTAITVPVSQTCMKTMNCVSSQCPAHYRLPEPSSSLVYYSALVPGKYNALASDNFSAFFKNDNAPEGWCQPQDTIFTHRSFASNRTLTCPRNTFSTNIDVDQRLYNDRSVRCTDDFKTFFYSSAVLMLLCIIVGTVVLQVVLTRDATQAIENDYVLDARSSIGLSADEVLEEKLRASKAVASTLYGPFSRSLRYWRSFAMLHKISVVFAATVFFEADRLSATTLSMTLSLAFHFVMCLCYLALSPYVSRTENYLAVATQTMLIVVSVVGVVGTARGGPVDVEELYITVAALVVAVPLLAYLVGLFLSRADEAEKEETRNGRIQAAIEKACNEVEEPEFEVLESADAKKKEEEGEDLGEPVGVGMLQSLGISSNDAVENDDSEDKKTKLSNLKRKTKNKKKSRHQQQPHQQHEDSSSDLKPSKTSVAIGAGADDKGAGGGGDDRKKKNHTATITTSSSSSSSSSSSRSSSKEGRRSSAALNPLDPRAAATSVHPDFASGGDGEGGGLAVEESLSTFGSHRHRSMSVSMVANKLVQPFGRNGPDPSFSFDAAADRRDNGGVSKVAAKVVASPVGAPNAAAEEDSSNAPAVVLGGSGAHDQSSFGLFGSGEESESFAAAVLKRDSPLSLVPKAKRDIWRKRANVAERIIKYRAGDLVPTIENVSSFNLTTSASVPSPRQEEESVALGAEQSSASVSNFFADLGKRRQRIRHLWLFCINTIMDSIVLASIEEILQDASDHFQQGGTEQEWEERMQRLQVQMIFGDDDEEGDGENGEEQEHQHQEQHQQQPVDSVVETGVLRMGRAATKSSPTSAARDHEEAHHLQHTTPPVAAAEAEAATFSSPKPVVYHTGDKRKKKKDSAAEEENRRNDDTTLHYNSPVREKEQHHHEHHKQNHHPHQTVSDAFEGMPSMVMHKVEHKHSSSSSSPKTVKVTTTTTTTTGANDNAGSPTLKSSESFVHRAALQRQRVGFRKCLVDIISKQHGLTSRSKLPPNLIGKQTRELIALQQALAEPILTEADERRVKANVRAVYDSHLKSVAQRQEATDYRTNRDTNLTLQVFFGFVGLCAFFSVGVAAVGLTVTQREDREFFLPPNGVDNATLQEQYRGEKLSTAKMQLAGYTSWASFVKSCCCTAFDNQTDSLALSVEKWICENGKVKERARRISTDGGVNALNSVRGLCKTDFKNGCELHVTSAAPFFVGLRGCFNVSAKEQELW